MADEEQLRILKQGSEAWNRWRQQAGAATRIDLTGAFLGEAVLRGANLSGADLNFADLSLANLRRANLTRANLDRADLTRANLDRADLTAANLDRADLSLAHLYKANLSDADLTKANLSFAYLDKAALSETNLRGVKLYETIISDVDLSGCKNLEAIDHDGPSLIDIRTLQRSGALPRNFLRGVGFPDSMISLLEQKIQHHSCFISYSSKDDEFVHRLHADLQDKGVRCWFAPHNMKIGAKILDTLDEAIRLRDKVLLVLSEASIASAWVEDEVTKAFDEERQRSGTVLFPVRVDDAVFDTKEAWAAKPRRSRHIGDFRAWKDHDAYQKALERVLRDLKIETRDAAAAERA